MKVHNHVAAAGTFDRLHVGHKKLLRAAFFSGKQVSIGICTHDLYKNKFLSDIVLPFQYRRGEIEEYLAKEGFLERATFYALSDIYGLARWDKTLQALVVSENTWDNGEKINKKRKSAGLALLELIKVDLERGRDGQIISSDRVRAGEIDRKGYNYFYFFGKKRNLLMPESLRSKLKEALGVVIPAGEQIQEAAVIAIRLLEKSKPTMIITVGDVATSALCQLEKIPDFSIIDYKTKRHFMEIFDKKRLSGDEKVPNPAGSITYKAVVAIQNKYQEWLKKGGKYQLIIEGEEDLTALPAILFAPLEAWVLYGHYALGLVAVHVTEDKKSEILQILGKFYPKS